MVIQAVVRQSGYSRKWPVVVLNVLAYRVKRIRALALTAHVALSKEPNF